MAIRQKEKTNKFLEITDPKKAVGLWSYYTVRETAMTPVGATKEALGRFLPQDVARWKRREEMAAAMEAGRRVPGARTKFKSPARIIAEYQEKAKQDTKRLKITEWQMKYRWLHLWERYACRLAAPSIVAGEKDTQMFFDAPSAGVNCHEGNLHSGRVFFLRTKVKGDLERRSLRDTQSFDRIGAATTARVELSSSVAPTPQLDSVEGSSHPKNASGAFSDSGVGSEATVVAGSENDLLSRSAQADCVQKSQYRYFAAVVLKPGGTKWWWSLERVNVTWTTNTYDRLIIDPRGKLEWSPMDAEVLTERVVEKDVCLFQLADDALFAAITDNELNPGEKYAHLCYDFDFFCRNPEAKVKVEGEGEQRNSSFCAPHIASPSELAPPIAAPAGRRSAGGYSLGGYSLTSGKDSASPLFSGPRSRSFTSGKDSASPLNEWYKLMLIGIYTGLRLGDCCRLDWSQINIAEGVIQVVPKKTRRHHQRMVTIPVHPALGEALLNAGGFRTQSPSANAELVETCAATTPPPDGVGYAATTFRPVSPNAPDAQNADLAFFDCGVGRAEMEGQIPSATVVSHIEKRQNCVCAASAFKIGPVLPTICEMYQRSRWQVSHELSRIFRAANIQTSVRLEGRHRRTPEATFHSLRHTFVSFAANAGVPLHIVQSIVGHESTAMTRHYYHENIDALKSAVAAIPTL